MPLNLINVKKGVRYVCHKCGFTTSAMTWMWKCPHCGHPLNLEFDVEKPRAATGRELMKVLPVKKTINLGEGYTPLIRRGEYELKMEGLNPTGSFKDRGWSIAASIIDAMLVEDSSGNAGVSLSAYSRGAGVRARIYVPHNASPSKKALMRFFGSEVVETADRSEAAVAALNDRDGVYVGHSWNPFFLEGTKLIAYELLYQAKTLESIVMPLGNGTLLLGLYRGFQEMIKEGLIKDIPRFIAVEAQGFCSAFSELTGQRCTGKATLPEGIMVGRPPRLDQIIDAVKESGGEVRLAGDNDVIAGLRIAASLGLIVEPTSAVVFVVKPVPGMVHIVTGTGLKTADIIHRILK